jgi:hypothetical protein
MFCVVTYVVGCLIWLYILVFYRQSKSLRTRTKLGNPSVMISSIADNCIPATICPQYTRLISRNRLCCYWSSHTFLITDLFALYHTHLVKLNRFCCFGSSQIVHPSELYAVYRTHLDLADRSCCIRCKQLIRVNRMSYIAHTLIWLIVYVVLAHRK